MERTILVAGGNTGIGRKSIERLTRDPGTRVICAVRNPGDLESLPGVSVIPFDAASPTLDPETLPDSLDGFVYFPGTISLKPFHRLTDEDFLADLQVNLMGAVSLLRACLGALKKAEQSSVVFFSTVAVETGMPFHASIAAAKGAVEGLARSLAAELAPRVRVNVIAPSLTDTPLAGRLLGSEDKVEASRQRHPLRQIGDPIDFAEMVAFLLSPQSRFMTGQVVKLDGGLSSVRLF